MNHHISSLFSIFNVFVIAYVFIYANTNSYAGIITNAGIWNAARIRDSKREIISVDFENTAIGEKVLIIENLLKNETLHIELRIVRKQKNIFFKKYKIAAASTSRIQLPFIIDGDKYVIHVTDSVLGIKDVSGFVLIRNAK